MGEMAPKLIVCGMGPMEEWCRKFIKTYDANIEMRGRLPNIEVRKLISNSKAFILPTQWYEGFPMTIVEAYSVGTPVICSKIGNAGSIVKEGITGYKFKEDSVDELKKTINNRYYDLYERARDEFNERYTDVKNYEILQMIYKYICFESNGKENV